MGGARNWRVCDAGTFSHGGGEAGKTWRVKLATFCLVVGEECFFVPFGE